MSGFAGIALPGSVPTMGQGRNITPDMLFRTDAEKKKYERIFDAAGALNALEIKKVEVRIFDLSDDKQRKDYEKLWAKLLPMVAKGEVVVDHSKDLVHRPDGTSYWMKHVEYVEFGNKGQNNGRKN